MNRLVQALRFLSIGDLAAGHIRTGVDARRVCAEAIEIQSQIVTGVEGSKACIECCEWSASVGKGRMNGQHPLGLQARRELLL